MNWKKALKPIVWAIVGAFVFIVIVAIFAGGDESQEYGRREMGIQEMRESFVRGCTEAGEEEVGVENRVFCECAFDEMLSMYGKEELIDVSLESLETGEYPDGLWDAVKECMYLFEY